MERTLFNIDDLGLCFVSWCLKHKHERIQMQLVEFHQSFIAAFESIIRDTSRHWSFKLTPHPVHRTCEAIDSMIDRLIEKKLACCRNNSWGPLFITCSPKRIEECFCLAEIPPWIRDYAERHFDQNEDLAS